MENIYKATNKAAKTRAKTKRVIEKMTLRILQHMKKQKIIELSTLKTYQIVGFYHLV
jgi:hypothetical protein